MEKGLEEYGRRRMRKRHEYRRKSWRRKGVKGNGNER